MSDKQAVGCILGIVFVLQMLFAICAIPVDSLGGVTVFSFLTTP